VKYLVSLTAQKIDHFNMKFEVNIEIMYSLKFDFFIWFDIEAYEY